MDRGPSAAKPRETGGGAPAVAAPKSPRAADGRHSEVGDSPSVMVESRFGMRGPWSLAEAQAYCRRLARSHYENFTVGSFLLPRRLRPHFYNVYAFCRTADDLADETGDAPRALRLLAEWRRELAECYAGRPADPVMVSLAATIGEFGIPREPFEDLIAAFEQDQRVQRYETFDELVDYCRRSANPVGRLVLYLLRSFDSRRAALSDSICTGLQLANFWQDVGRDLDQGRIYLPAEDRRRFGYRDEDFYARRYNPAFRALMAMEVDRAREFFDRGAALVGLVPRRARLDVELFIRGGLAILGKISKIGYDVWSQRPTLSRWDKLVLAARAVAGRAIGKPGRRRETNERRGPSADKIEPPLPVTASAPRSDPP